MTGSRIPPQPRGARRQQQPRQPFSLLLLGLGLLLLLLADLAAGFVVPAPSCARPPLSPSPPSLTAAAAAAARHRTKGLVLARTPARPPQRPHSKVPVTVPGQHDLKSLRTNQPLTGKVLGVYEGRTCRKLFVDVGATRKGGKQEGVYYPVFGMVRLAGKYSGGKYSPGQRVDVYVDRAQPAQGRLTLSLTPVYRRPSHDAATGEALPMYDLTDLTVGMPLQGRVVSVTAHYAFVDCGVVVPPPPREGEEEGDGQRKKGKGRRINGKLYRLDLQERWAISPRQRTAKTEAVLAPGMDLKVFVKGVHPASGEYTLTADPEMTEEKAQALRAEREALRAAMDKKQDVDKLLIGESRKGVITKILPGGCKVGIGAKRTGFVPLDSIADAYGKEVKNLNKILVVGGRLQVEIDEISDDGERIDLRCLEIYKQVAPPKKQQQAAAPAAPKKAAAAAAKAPSRYEEDEDEDDDDFADDEDEDDFSRLGYDDEW